MTDTGPNKGSLEPRWTLTDFSHAVYHPTVKIGSDESDKGNTMTDRDECLSAKLKELLADEVLSDSYSTPLPMQRKHNARRSEKYRSLAIEQAAEITHLNERVRELEGAEPIWIVNEIGELGVMVNGICYFMYKSGNIVYDGLPYDDGDGEVTRKIRTPFKREFGECVQPLDMDRLIKTGECRYKKMGLSEGEWVDMPEPPKWFKPSHKRGIEFMPEIRAALNTKDG